MLATGVDGWIVNEYLNNLKNFKIYKPELFMFYLRIQSMKRYLSNK